MTTQSPPWPPLFAAINFRLKPNTGLFQSPLTGAMQVSARPGDQWQCEITLPVMARSDHDAWSAWLSRAASRAEPVYLNDYKNALPRNYLTGVTGALTCDATTPKCDTTGTKCDAAFSYGNPYVNGASQTGRSIITGGWLAAATIYAGTNFAFDNGTYIEFHKVESDATASAGGAATLSLIPPIRRSPADRTEIRVDGTCAAITHRCVGEFLIRPGDAVGWVSDPGGEQIESFTAVEYLR